MIVPVRGGAERASEVYFPSANGSTVDPGAGRCPVVAFGPGFSRTKDRYTDFGELLYAAANPRKRGVKLVGANHCDPEKDNDVLGCVLTCGAWNATRHKRYLRYVTGWAVSSRTTPRRIHPRRRESPRASRPP